MGGLTAVQVDAVERYRGLALRWAGRFAARRADLAEDLRQTALLALCAAVSEYDPSRDVPLGAWLARSVRLALLDHLAAAGRDALIDRRALPSARRPDVSEQLAEADEVERLLARVAAADRPVVDLVFAADLSISEAAEALGISRSRASRRLADALAAMGRTETGARFPTRRRRSLTVPGGPRRSPTVPDGP